jgi:hypothetical protein
MIGLIKRILKEEVNIACELEFQKNLPRFIKSNLKKFRDVIDLMLEPKKEQFKGDTESYRQILKLLKKSDAEINNILDIKFVYHPGSNEWSRINKLNTNYSDLSVFFFDILKDEDTDFCVMNERLVNKDNTIVNELINKMMQNADLYFDKYLMNNEEKYTQNNKKNSEKGDISEQKVIDFVTQTKIGWDLIYQAKEGSPIDTKLGVDLIFRNPFGVVKTVQVKSVGSIKGIDTTPCEKEKKFTYKLRPGGYFVFSRYGVKINTKEVDYVAYVSSNGRVLLCKKYSPVTVVGFDCVDVPVNVFPANPRGSFYVDHESVLLKNFF